VNGDPTEIIGQPRLTGRHIPMAFPLLQAYIAGHSVTFQ
jgi:hypothetical protein